MAGLGAVRLTGQSSGNTAPVTEMTVAAESGTAPTLQHAAKAAPGARGTSGTV